MDESPLYVSKRTAKSLWQEYRIYRDRVELQCWTLFRTFIIPIEEIERIEVRPCALFSVKGMTLWGLKLDYCDLCPHVLLRKKSGIMKGVAFAPDDPEKFASLCHTLMSGNN
jgi:hypothetical protein